MAHTTTDLMGTQFEQPVSNWLLIAGYVFAFLGGLIGIIIGIWIWTHKVTVDGARMPQYDQNSRRHGKIIFWIALGMFFLGSIVSGIEV